MVYHTSKNDMTFLWIVLRIKLNFTCVFIIIYVDDLVTRGEHLASIEHIKKLLSSRFEMKDMKELHYFLGIEVIRTPDGIMLSQRHYILNLLYKFGMTAYKPVTTPLNRNLKLDVESGKEKCELTS